MQRARRGWENRVENGGGGLLFDGDAATRSHGERVGVRLSSLVEDRLRRRRRGRGGGGVMGVFDAGEEIGGVVDRCVVATAAVEGVLGVVFAEEEVVSVAAEELVGTGAAVEDVVAGQAIELVV